MEQQEYEKQRDIFVVNMLFFFSLNWTLVPLKLFAPTKIY